MSSDAYNQSASNVNSGCTLYQKSFWYTQCIEIKKNKDIV